MHCKSSQRCESKSAERRRRRADIDELDFVIDEVEVSSVKSKIISIHQQTIQKTNHRMVKSSTLRNCQTVFENGEVDERTTMRFWMRIWRLTNNVVIIIVVGKTSRTKERQRQKCVHRCRVMRPTQRHFSQKETFWLTIVVNSMTTSHSSSSGSVNRTIWTPSLTHSWSMRVTHVKFESPLAINTISFSQCHRHHCRARKWKMENCEKWNERNHGFWCRTKNGENDGDDNIKCFVYFVKQQ